MYMYTRHFKNAVIIYLLRKLFRITTQSQATPYIAQLAQSIHGYRPYSNLL